MVGHLDLRYSVAKQMRAALSDDLLSDMSEALVHAAAKWDMTKSKFITYAQYWLRAAVYTFFLRQIGGQVGVGRGSNQVRYLAGRGKRKAFADMTEDETQMLVRTLKVPLHVIQAIEGRTLKQDVPLDGKHFHGPDTNLDCTPSPDGDVCAEDTLDGQREYRERMIKVLQAMYTLPLREQEILTRRYLSGVERSLASVGQDYGIGRERVRQLEQRALLKIKQQLGQ